MSIFGDIGNFVGKALAIPAQVSSSIGSAVQNVPVVGGAINKASQVTANVGSIVPNIIRGDLSAAETNVGLAFKGVAPLAGQVASGGTASLGDYLGGAIVNTLDSTGVPTPSTALSVKNPQPNVIPSNAGVVDSSGNSGSLLVPILFGGAIILVLLMRRK